MADNSSSNAYWKANIRIISISLVVWFMCSFGFGILLRPMLSGSRSAAPIWASGLPSKGRFWSFWC